MTSQLFTPITLGPQTYPNRIVIAPMAQYSAVDGSPTDWHLIHWGGLATSGAGLVMIEACGVERDGRPTPGDVGLYSDDNEAGLTRVLASIRENVGPVKFGVQLFHGGRKGSATVHWEGGGPLSKEKGGWDILAPSPIQLNEGWPVPKEADEADLDRIEGAHVQATQRAGRAGFDCVELHAAHGYLLHQFLSGISNQRTDRWGGSLENRMRYPLRIFDAVKKAAPATMTLGVRLTGSDWIEGGITPDEAVAFAKELKARGCHYVDVTSGALDPRLQKITVGPGYQVGFAETVKREVGIPVRAVGLIVTPRQAEDVIASGKADQIAIARAALVDPHWPWRAAYELGAKLDVPRPYARAVPGVWPGWGYER